MQFLRATLFGRVSPGPGGISAQKIAKRKMAIYMRGILLEEMQLDVTKAFFAGKRAITPSGNSKFPMPLVTQIFHRRTAFIQGGKTGNDRHQINDWLGGEAGDCGGTNVMNDQQNRSKN